MNDIDYFINKFEEWAKTHNRDNYGRYDAFRAGYFLGFDNLEIVKQAINILISNTRLCYPDDKEAAQNIEAAIELLNRLS